MSTPAAGQAPPPGSVPEAQRLRHRRTAAALDPEAPVWGLAFSGGGIRSATFCLGLARALAANAVLKRFDYLSTVSGGGYAGAALGRLYSRNTPADAVSAGVANDRSLLLWWLRRNGRFLLPAGARDALNAAAGYLRGFIATQFEVAILALVVSCAIVLPHVLVLMTPALAEAGAPLVDPWWALLPVIAFLALASSFAYWFTREPEEAAVRAQDGVLAGVLAAAAVAVALTAASMRAGPSAALLRGAAWTLALMLASAPLGWLVQLLWRREPARAARVRFTHLFSRLVVLALIVSAIGAFDLVTWVLAQWLSQGRGEIALGGVGATVALAALLRSLAPLVQNLGRGGQLPFRIERVAHYGGLLLCALVFGLWLLATQWLVFFADYRILFGEPSCMAWACRPPVAPWLVLSASLLVYVVLSSGNLEQLNRASLHPFYRSRLARAYVSVGNSTDHGRAAPAVRFNGSMLADAERSVTDAVRRITEYVDGDDVRLGDYAPDRFGGPIHLVNCCVNQTVDDRTDAYNADRKGMYLTVSSLGREIGRRDPEVDAALAQTELSHWIAVSGAAVGAGMGSMTRPGIAALSFLTGLRLGYWWRKAPQLGPLAKYRAIAREMLGRFPGWRSPAVYVSDGGHFDNTGIYALLKRRPRLIIAADCGADPQYVFADLENLVRKARIDYDADIEFIDPASLEPLPELAPLVERLGTPEDITAAPSPQYLVLGRIKYADRSIGALLVVKPRRVEELPVDVAGYADRDADFPQQTTGDQFFDEAQWESYCELGRALGQALTADLLEGLQAAVENGEPIGARTLVRPVTAPEPTRRERLVTAVGQTAGVGAALSLVVAGWQAWDDYRERIKAAERDEFQTVDRLLRGGPGEPSPLRQIFANRQVDDGSLQELIAGIEQVGSLHGALLQDSARRRVLNELFQRCLSEAAAEVTEEARAQRDRLLRGCAHGIAILSMQPRSPWSVAVDDYWDHAVGPASRSLVGPCKLRQGRRTYLVVHLDDSVSDRVIRAAAAAARERQVRLRFDASDGLDVGSLDAADRLAFKQPTLLSTHLHGECATELRTSLESRLQEYGAEPVSQYTGPAFSHAVEDIHVWIPPERQLQILARARRESQRQLAMLQAQLAQPPSDDADVAAIVRTSSSAASGVADHAGGANSDAAAGSAPAGGDPQDAPDLGQVYGDHTVYVQFQGSCTRAQINAFRDFLATPYDADKGVFNVPLAERIGGDYPNVVKYFDPGDEYAARVLATRTNAYFERQGQPFEPPVEARWIASKGAKALEVWVKPVCTSATAAR